jgi:enoyl-CoA hydratase/carnithine racemase
MDPRADTDSKASAGGKMLAIRSGSIGMLVINNPERRNALSLDMWQAAAEILEAFANDDAVRVLVVCGAGGKAFASGADISKFEEERTGAEAVQFYQQVSGGVYDSLASFPKPTIAQISGYCIGGGLALALCCDLRFCEEGSRFGVPAARLGIGYGPASQKRLFDLVGPGYGAEMIFSARQFDAGEAAGMGLVNRVLPAQKLEEFVADYAAQIAENAPLSLATAKAVKIALGAGVFPAQAETLQGMVERCYVSADYEEGKAAFNEKRKPKFTGD